MIYQEEFIAFMMRVGVPAFGDFITKSDRRIPYFINTGNYKAGAQVAKLGDYYVACIQQNLSDGVDYLFGPVYRDIPLVASVVASLHCNCGRDLPYYFSRKEVKGHGEDGVVAGYKPRDGDRVVIVEDVVTTGTAVWESIELFQYVANVKMHALIASVDRVERGIRAYSTLDELREDYGIAVYPIVTIREIIAFLHNRELGGRVYINDEMKSRTGVYLGQYDTR